MSEATAPPTEQQRERRDTEYVRMAGVRYAQGWDARLGMLHPMKRNASGKELQQRESKWSYCEPDSSGRCLRTWKRCPGADPGGGTAYAWPKHECERWVAAFMAADAICAERGLVAASAAHPARTPRKARVVVAEPLDAFPEAMVSKDEARQFWDRHRGIHQGFTTADEQE